MNLKVFGICADSNYPIPWLHGETSAQIADTSIELKSFNHAMEEPPQTPWYKSEQVLVHRAVSTKDFVIRYDDGSCFVVNENGTRICADWPASVTIEDACTYLLGPVIGFALRLRGFVCLHASAVSIDGCGVAFVGAAGSGKSTLAAAFAQRGYPVLTDDVLVIDDRSGQFWGMPGVPHVRLWPDSVKLLFGDSEVLPRMTPLHPTWDKRYLELNAGSHAYQKTPVPLRGIYVLGPEREEVDFPSFRYHEGQAVMMDLVGNSYVSYLLDRGQRSYEFEMFAKLAQTTRIRLMSRGRSIVDTVDGIIEDFKKGHVSSI